MRSPQPSSFLLLVSFFLSLLFLFLLSERLVEALLLACVSVLVVLEPTSSFLWRARWTFPGLKTIAF